MALILLSVSLKRVSFWLMKCSFDFNVFWMRTLLSRSLTGLLGNKFFYMRMIILVSRRAYSMIFPVIESAKLVLFLNSFIAHLFSWNSCFYSLNSSKRSIIIGISRSAKTGRALSLVAVSINSWISLLRKSNCLLLFFFRIYLSEYYFLKLSNFWESNLNLSTSLSERDKGPSGYSR